MSRFSLRAAKETFLTLPRIFKLLIVFALVNTFLIAGITGTRLVIFQNTAIVKSINVGVYSDADCSSIVNAIDWGKIEPGEDKIVDVFIRNEGNSDVILQIRAVDWSPPEVSQYATLKCTHQGQIIEVGGTVKVSLILSLNSTVTEIANFSFDIMIEASG